MKRSPLRQRSEKRIREDVAFAPIRQAVIARDGNCQLYRFVGLRHRCWGPLVVHHIISRARDKTLALEPDNLITLCFAGHNEVHDNVAESTELGLLKSAPLLSPHIRRIP